MNDVPPADLTGQKVADVMSRSVVHIGPDENINRAATLIDRHGVRRLPVIDTDGYVVGIVARSDLVRSMAGADLNLETELVPLWFSDHGSRAARLRRWITLLSARRQGWSRPGWPLRRNSTSTSCCNG